MKGFYCLILILTSGFWCPHLIAQQAEIGKPLPPWKAGLLDIHHINTGRGNAAYCILPDGTTLLIDAGELSPLDSRTFTPRNSVIRPDSSKKPYQWIAQYIQKTAPGKTIIDYALLTHFHDDHFGAWYPEAPRSEKGNYVLTGITGVAELIPVHTLIDRGYPSYNYPYAFKTKSAIYGGGEIAFNNTMQNYFAFTAAGKMNELHLDSLRAGSRTQIVLLKEPEKYPNFYIQNIKNSQWIWTGSDSATNTHYPESVLNNPATWPDENALSLALTINYGPFTYYTGGDNPGIVFLGDDSLRDLETPIAKVVGEVDVATMDHHGNRDALNTFMIQTLKPAIWIGQTWSADHPGHEVLIRLTSRDINSKPGKLFATNMLEANKLVIGPLIDQSYTSQQGHVVVRVKPGGSAYDVIVLDDINTAMNVKSISGPYQSKSNKQ